jgi:uncharacterized protein with NRDE domain
MSFLTDPLHQWESGIYAGKDLKGGGTWMGFHPSGKWALVTNFRDFNRRMQGKISRGKLVLDFLEGDFSPSNYLDRIEDAKHQYDGFNLLVSEGDQLFYLSNYGNGPKEIQPGIHGLSNGMINEPWPKTALAKTQIQSLPPQEISSEGLLTILKSTQTFPLDTLPKTGVEPDMEIQLSAQLIRMNPNYGTVSASSVLRENNGFTHIQERRFDWDYRNYRDKEYRFQP